MKNRACLVVAFSCILAVAACSSTDEGGGGGEDGDFAISGHFVADQARLHSLDVGQVAKVLAFSADGDLWTAAVTDGAFSVNVDVGAPLGLIFVGVSDDYHGYLTLGNDIDSIPLTKLADGTTSIDLATLTQDGSVVEPGHNPLGDELPLTADERQAVAFGNKLFGSVIKNPDVDGDGALDILGDRFYVPSILYWVVGGSFTDLVGVPVENPSINGFRIMAHIRDRDGGFPEIASFGFPGGSGSCTVEDDVQLVTEGSHGAIYFSCFVDNDPVVPVAGAYSVGYKTYDLTFQIPDQSEADSHVVLPIPTVTLNGDDTVNRVSWVYKLPGGTDEIDPTAAVSEVMVQLDNNDGTTFPCSLEQQENRMYSSDGLPALTQEHILDCQLVPWSAVGKLYMAYNDTFGNHYVVDWVKEH